MNFPHLLLRPALLVATSLCLLLGGCGRKEAGKAAGAENTTAGLKILQFGNGAEPQFIDPQLATGVPENHLLIALFEGLVTENPKEDGPPLPGVATRWDISPDGLTYTFHLRESARWSNGNPVTSDDFIGAYQRILNPALAADYVYMMFVVKGAEDYFHGALKDFSKTGFQAPDAHTLVLTLKRPAPFLINALVHPAWYPLPIKLIEKLGGMARRDSGWTRPENFVGNGPFKLKEWYPSQKIVTERSPTYWDRENVKLDQIHFHAVELADTEERMFRSGQLDITNEMPVTKIAVYRRDRPEALSTAPWCGTYFFRFNVARKPLDDVRVRRALSLAVDRESLIRNVTLGGEKPAYSLVPPHTAGYVPKYRMEGDLAEAKRLLAEAGFPDGKGFPRLDLLYNTLEKHRVIAEAIQEMWRRNLGIDIGLHNEEWRVYLVDQKNMNFDIERAGWLADYVDPHVFFDLWTTGNGNNCTNWGSARYDQLLQAALETKDNAARYAVYNEMEKIIIDEMPIIPLFFYTQNRLVSPRVLNYRTTPLDTFPWKYVDLAR
jgi:oligopeptide transport system substrate-binding protein